ncbi:MAG TPA: molybdenum cofactor biosynthesis protein MoaE [Tepidisphaeraceae bacterium]|jgi:molybdopterin synthase catalytic subunit|nr:molybdenum cofactor biosynthesis protein MoaE [Tepidisphaeraceae bacterium]
MDRKNDIIALQSTALDIGAAIGDVGDHGSGAIAVFLGTTRGEVNAQGRELVALDYEAYAEMAETQMRQMAEDARRRWPISRIVMLHRTGLVDVGQPSVLIAVSTPHRAEAFGACRFLIDDLKKQATIWKKEVWSDRSSTWAEGRGRQP